MSYRIGRRIRCFHGVKAVAELKLDAATVDHEPPICFHGVKAVAELKLLIH